MSHYEKTSKLPSQVELVRQVDALEAQALTAEAPEREVHLRAACARGRIFIDIGDATWRIVEVDPDGWRVIDNRLTDVRLVRTPNMRPMPFPETGGSIEALRSLINVATEDDFVLLIAWMLDALRNEGPKSVLVLSGGEGTAKTFLVAILTALIDPNHMPLQGLPRTERQLVAQARGGYLLPFDNVSAISVSISDALCRISRDSGDPIMINGIDEVVTRPDLVDRSVFVSCNFIPDSQRRSEQELWTAFEHTRPQILGVLFDALSVGLRRLPDIHPDRLPRMADFARWATACETAFWPTGTFLDAYWRNRAEAVEKVIDADIVASAVRKLRKRGRVGQGRRPNSSSPSGQVLRPVGGATHPEAPATLLYDCTRSPRRRARSGSASNSTELATTGIASLRSPGMLTLQMAERSHRPHRLHQRMVDSSCPRPTVSARLRTTQPQIQNTMPRQNRAIATIRSSWRTSGLFAVRTMRTVKSESAPPTKASLMRPLWLTAIGKRP